VAKLVLTGIPVSAGIAIGKAFFMNRRLHGRIPRQTIAKHFVPGECERFDQRVAQAVAELETVRAQVPAEFKEHGLMIDSHVTILKDPKLRDMTFGYIEDMRINAEWALLKAVHHMEKKFAPIADEYFRQRIQDVRLVADRVLSQLMGLTRG